MATETNDLPNAVSGERREIDTPSGRVAFYSAGIGTVRPPMLLVHSINAAGSAYEVRPIYERMRASRRVYAIDLPGFGFSERSDRPYTPDLMVGAIQSLAALVRQECAGAAVDALALSLSSEFLARAASEWPDDYRSLALVSPTGFDKRAPYLEPPGTTRAKPAFYKTLRFPLWDRGFFSLLTSRPSIRFFLEKTWGSKNIDEGLFEYDYRTTHQPGARFAPYYFVSGYLFSLDITRVYEALTMPVWLAHGVKGDFQDYSYAAHFAGRPNWTVTEFPTGALPQFEVLDDFLAAYAAFLEPAPGPAAPVAQDVNGK